MSVVSRERYRLVRPLSEGGEGRIWLADDLHKSGKRVALKSLHDDIDVAVLAREFDTLRRLSHPHVATVMDFDRGGGGDAPFLTESYVDGTDLVSALTAQPLQTVGRVLAQVLQALEYVHARGVIHGDIKPNNILVEWADGSPSAHLIDFGMAKHADEAPSGVSGTLAFLAPERLHGQAASVASDLYAFGVTAYEVLTGRPPFVTDDVQSLLKAHLEASPEPPSHLCSNLPAPVDAVLARLLEKDPAHRPESARETLIELVEAIGLRWDAETAETLKGYLHSSDLVGRVEITEQATALRRALLNPLDAVRPRMLWWEGEPGAGRSRVLRQLGGDAQIDGIQVAHARAGEGGPLGPVRSWLRALGIDKNPITGSAERWDAVESAAAFLMECASKTAVLLTLDDGEKIGPMMVDVIRVLLIRLAEGDIPGHGSTVPRMALVVAGGSLPTGLDVSDANIGTQVLRQLTQKEVGSWLGNLLPGTKSLPKAFVNGVYRLTDGLPGHVVTLLAAMAERGHLKSEAGALVAGPKALEGPLPKSISDAISIREKHLTKVDREVLDLLRVLTRPASPALIASLSSDLTSEAIEESLGVLVDRGLVGPSDWEGAVRYRAESAANMLSNERQRKLHEHIARTLMDQAGRNVAGGFGPSVISLHIREAVRLGAKRLDAAGLRMTLAAADESAGFHAGEDEAKYLEWALDYCGEPLNGKGRAIALRLGALQRRMGQFDAAVETFERVLKDDGLPAADIECAVLGLAGVDHDRGEYPSALKRCESLSSQGDLPTQALVRLARTQLMMGRYDDALKTSEAGLKRKPEPAQRLELCDVQALVHYYKDRLDEALPAFDAERDAAAAASDLCAEARAITGRGLIHHRRGDFSAALNDYEISLALAQKASDRKRVAVAAMNIGTVLHETGRSVDAVERYRESLRAAEVIGDGASVAKVANNLANLLVQLNQLSEARYWHGRSAIEARRNQMALLEAYNRVVDGMILHDEGNTDDARKALTEGLSQLREMGASGEVREALIDLGMVSRTEGDVAGMDHYAAAIRAEAQTSGTSKQLAYASFLSGEARRVSGDTQEAIKSLRDSLALAEQHKNVDLVWRCEGALARCYREVGNSLETRARFHACESRIMEQAEGMSGRNRDMLLAHAERAALIQEAQLAAGEPAEGSEPMVRVNVGHDHLMRMMEINRRLVSEHDSQRLLEFILDSAVALTGAERGFIILVTESDQSEVISDEPAFEVRAARNIDQETLRSSRARLSQSIASDVLKSGEPIITVNAGEDDRFRKALSVHHLKLRSILCFPLRAQGKVIGAIYLDNRFQVSTFQDQDLAGISAFADQAAVAIMNARLHEQMERTKAELLASNEKIESLNAELQEQVSDQATRLEEVEESLEMQRTQLETRYRYENIIGVSPALQRIFSVLDRVTDTDIPVLIQGESGTGKELVARAVHYNGRRRRDRSFVSVNCAALTETLLESELFGHVRGAFTGADRDRKGLFTVADGGTLFLDEVADMSLAMQAKLLRVLQEGEVWAVGANRSIHVDVRIVTACNRDLAEMVKTKEFRQDLFFRLNVVRVDLPALRERGDDIILLIRHFLNEFAEKNETAPKKVSKKAMDCFTRYGWPGNVRELEATIMNACLFCDGDTITPAELAYKPDLLAPASGSTAGHLSDGADGDGTMTALDGLSLAQLEEKAVLAALERAAGNKVEAARQLGITRQTLYNKLKTYGIEVKMNIRRAGS